MTLPSEHAARPDGPTYFVSYGATCPGCGCDYLATAGEIPETHRPDTRTRLGEASTSICLCGTTLAVAVVAIGIEPYKVGDDRTAWTYRYVAALEAELLARDNSAIDRAVQVANDEPVAP